MQSLGKSAPLWGALVVLACHGGSQRGGPESPSTGEQSERSGSTDAAGGKSEPPPAQPGPCGGAPLATAVLADAERAHEFARTVDEYLKQLRLPPPAAPHTVENAERWIAQAGQPWFDAQARRVTEFEGALAQFSEGTFGHARATVSVAGAWSYLAQQRPSIRGEAARNYDVRVAYYGDWPRHGEGSLGEHADRWRERARRLASEWGLFQIGVERPWLSQHTGMFLRQPFPASAQRDLVSPLLPGSVNREVSALEWPTSANDVLELDQFGLTPRQLICARRYEKEPGVKAALGRYFTTRALLFGDPGALEEAQRLLAEEADPASVVDRGILMWLARRGAQEPYDEDILRKLFDLLPPGDLSRRRLYLNVLRTDARPLRVADLGPPESSLPSGEQRADLEPAASTLPPGEQRPRFGLMDPGFSQSEPRAAFSWWIPAPKPEGSEAGRVEGVRAELSDGSYVFIPYGDDGLDLCAMALVAPDGQRSPHRPPDVAERCASRWQQ